MQARAQRGVKTFGQIRRSWRNPTLALALTLAFALTRIEVFYRMGFDDQEIVALLCGGHVYGRCHPSASGYAQSNAHANPNPSTCAAGAVQVPPVRVGVRGPLGRANPNPDPDPRPSPNPHQLRGTVGRAPDPILERLRHRHARR